MNNLTQEQIIKQAFWSEFIDGALSTLKDKVDFKHKPFELIFGTLVPSIVFSKSWLFGSLLFFAEAAGYGPGYFGAMIDEKLGLRSGTPDLSDAKLQETSKSIIDDLDSGFSLDNITDFLKEKYNQVTGFIAEKLSSDYNAMLNDIMIIKGYVSENDIFSAKAYSACSTGIIKQAAGGWVDFIKQTVIGKKFTLAGFLLNILRKVAFGLIGLGIAGGITSVYKSTSAPGAPGKSKEESGIIMPKGVGLGGPNQTYQNKNNNVTESIVEYLDGEFIFRDKTGTKDLTFSQKFQELYNQDILSSPKLTKLLEDLPYRNHLADVSTINSWDMFNGPNLDTIANSLIPGIKDETEAKPQIAQTQTKKPSIKKDKSEEDFARYFS